MGTLILIAIVVIAILLYKRKKGNSESVPVTDPATDTTEKYPENWYVLYRCDDSKNYYAAQLTENPVYTIGSQVEGATGIFYTIIGATKSPGSPIITGITPTGKMGC